MKKVYILCAMLLSSCHGSGSKLEAGLTHYPLPEKACAHVKFISVLGTSFVRSIAETKKVPRGSAVLTSSGDLSSKGITAIIHAATGSRDQSLAESTPNLDGVRLSIQNSLALAKQFNHSRVAIPFIGGGIFLSRIGVSAEVLAQTIVQSALEFRDQLEIRFVLFSPGDSKIFQDALDTLLTQSQYKDLSPATVAVTQGGITDFSLHQASAIVNAANMEIEFGGGISGAIGKETGHSFEIDAEAASIKAQCNEKLLAGV